MNWKIFIANVLLVMGIRPTYSTGVGGELTAGYGKLNEWGHWEYPVDPKYRKSRSN